MPRPPMPVLLLALCLATAPGCTTDSPDPASFTVLAGDTILVTAANDAVNLAVTNAAYAVGATEPVPGTGATRLPSYQERSEYRSVERDGSKVILEQRTVRFQTPDGVWLEALIMYSDDSTSILISSEPASASAEGAFAEEISRVLRERGATQWP